jgi:hypothetical protein
MMQARNWDDSKSVLRICSDISERNMKAEQISKHEHE